MESTLTQNTGLLSPEDQANGRQGSKRPGRETFASLRSTRQPLRDPIECLLCLSEKLRVEEGIRIKGDGCLADRPMSCHVQSVEFALTNKDIQLLPWATFEDNRFH